MRREFVVISLVLIAMSVSMALQFHASWGWTIFFGALFLLGVYDMLQRKHTILRNFPIVGHFRYILEMFRPEIKQYFVESDTSPEPISRIYRSLVYERAKGDLETVPFGTVLDIYNSDYHWLNHSCFPVEPNAREFRVSVGNSQCRRPYSASLFNISAMSFGSLSKTAIEALGRGAKLGGFYHNTGEGGLSPYHLGTGADIVWQLGTAYFGARGNDGYFDSQAFREKSAHPNVKMIEIKISQGAKPGHGGILPGVKVDKEIAAIRRVPEGKTVISPPGHTAFTNPLELCKFIARVRDLCDGKPVGFKFCLGRREEFLQICEAMSETKIYPDFITVDGGEGGTGAAPFDFINYVGSPLKEALFFVHTTLNEYDLRQHIRLIASGKVMTGYDMFEKFALGADLCNSARGMMLALGCIQAYRCNTNKCPTGIATNNPSLYKGLDVADKAGRVARFQERTLESFLDLLGAAGLHDPKEIGLQHISARFQNRTVNLHELYEHTIELSRHERAEAKRAVQGEPRKPEPPV